EDVDDRSPDRFDVARGTKRDGPALSPDLLEGRDVPSDHGESVGQGFREGDSKSFRPAQGEEEAARAPEVAQVCFRNKPPEADAIQEVGARGLFFDSS